jgi:hypothetical protein
MVYDPITKKELNAEELCDKLKESIKAKKPKETDHYLGLLIEEVAPLTVESE